ncbi:MAG: hypothetical protein KDD89_04895, partial [Anaerolineales bacterium]|nr:hypothetical protein [Anaerolineales bacterium]
MQLKKNRIKPNYLFAVALLFLLGLAGWGYWLFLRGWVDPRPLGAVTQRVVPGEVVFSGAGHRGRGDGRPTAVIQWHIEPDLATGEPFAVQLAGQFVRGELDSAYGLALGTEEEGTELIVWLTPTGYAGLSLGDAPLVQLAPWPHVRGASDSEGNEIWVERDAAGVIAIRLNRELFWQGEVASLTGRAG